MNSSNRKQSRAVIFTRTAVAQNGNGSGTEGQMEACRALAAQSGLDIAAIFSDEGVSGLKRDRLQLNALRDLVTRDASIRAVIVADLSRLTRSMATLIELRLELLKKGVLIHCAQQGRAVKIGTLDLGCIDLSRSPSMSKCNSKTVKAKINHMEDTT